MRSKLRFSAIILAVVMMFSNFAFAAQDDRVDLGNGFYMITTEKMSDIQLYDGSKTVEKTGNVYYSGTHVGSITLTATFVYGGSSVAVTSKSISVSTDNGWSYKNSKTSSSGGTATASCTFYKGSQSTSASVSITCDKNGNVS